MRTYALLQPRGLLTLEFDKKTRPFLKIDMQHEAYRRRQNISDMRGGFGCCMSHVACRHVEFSGLDQYIYIMT